MRATVIYMEYASTNPPKHFRLGVDVACYINWMHRDTRERAADTDLLVGVL